MAASTHLQERKKVGNITKKIILLITVLMVSLVATMFIATAQAGTASSINSIDTYDSSGNLRTSTSGSTEPFYVGEYIYIAWTQTTFLATVDVSATDPSSGTVSIYKVSTALGPVNPGTTPESTLWTDQSPSQCGYLAIYAATAGDYNIKIDGAGAVTETLAVTVKDPTIDVAPDLKAPGTTVTITGTDFQPSSTITVTFKGSPVTLDPSTVTTDTNGDFTATFTVPTLADGPYEVIATDSGSHSASTTYNISSIVVTPENPLGVIASLAAIGLAFVAWTAVKRQRTTVKPAFSQ